MTPDPGYTPDPADVELVMRTLATEDVRWGYYHGFSAVNDQETAAFATAVLSALAAAGWLLPADAETRTEWGFARWDGDPVIWQTLEQSARSTVAGNPGFVLMRRQVRVGPWLPVPEEDADR